MLGKMFGKEIICYNTIDEAALLIKHYLKRDVEREKIRNLSVNKARSSHTYKHRTQEFMKEIKSAYQMGKN